MGLRFENVGIAVEDLEEAVDFFQGLGLVVVGREEVQGEWADTAVGLDGNHARIALLTAPDGGPGVELSEYLHPEVLPTPDTLPHMIGMHRVAFRVDDLDAALAACDGRPRRSNPATYTGLLEPLRKAFAKANGVKPGLFSSNSDGACPACKGAGVIYTDLATLGGVESVCEECQGRRFLPEVLELTLAGRSIADVLEMSVDQAAAYMAEGEARLPAAQKVLGRLQDVGLGYLTVGQPLTTLSGGERQRLKLAVQMGERAEVYVLDEPTTGLHLADVDQLLALLDRLVDGGTSVVVIEHHQAVVAHADWIVDLGPGAGHDGGRIVFEGTPAALVADASTLTGRHLKEYVGA